MGKLERTAQRIIQGGQKYSDPKNKLAEIKEKFFGVWYLKHLIEKIIFLIGGFASVYLLFLLFEWIF